MVQIRPTVAFQGKPASGGKNEQSPESPSLRQRAETTAMKHDVPDKALKVGNVISKLHLLLRQAGLPAV